MSRFNRKSIITSLSLTLFLSLTIFLFTSGCPKLNIKWQVSVPIDTTWDTAEHIDINIGDNDIDPPFAVIRENKAYIFNFINKGFLDQTITSDTFFDQIGMNSFAVSDYGGIQKPTFESFSIKPGKVASIAFFTGKKSGHMIKVYNDKHDIDKPLSYKLNIE